MNMSNHLEEHELFFIDGMGEHIGKLAFEINKDTKTAFINYTYIFTEYRGQGILKNNITGILNDMKHSGARVVRLHTITEDAKVVWEHLGFKKVSEELSDGVLKTIMERELVHP